MGTSYIEILTNFTKRLFNWFLDLFDYKIIPNFPNNKPNIDWWAGPKANTWYTKPISDSNLLDVLTPPSDKNITTDSININKTETSIIKDWSTVFWILGGTIAIAGVVTLGYMGYSYYQAIYGLKLFNNDSKRI
jgi:hypothetical protein